MIPAKFYRQLPANRGIFQEGLIFRQVMLCLHSHQLCSAFISAFNVDFFETLGFSSPPPRHCMISSFSYQW